MRTIAFVLTVLALAACSGGQPPTTAPTSTSGPSATAQPTSVPTAALTAIPTATESGTAGSAYEQLLTFIPPAIANTCDSDPANAQIERAIALAVCEPVDVIVGSDVTINRLMYFLFDSDEYRTTLWSGYWEALGEPPDGECAAGPATSLYYADDTPVGRLVCGQWPQSSDLAAWWYDDRPNVVMFLRIDGSYADLAALVDAVSVQP